MADNELTGTGKAVATRKVTYSGDADQNAQVMGVVIFAGSDDAKTVADMPGGSGVVTAGTPRVVLATDVALPAGTNNIGDMDVLSIIPGTGATNAGKAVDSVAGATDTGTAMLVVRDDALTTLTPADGDYTYLRVSSTGALHVTGAGGGTEYNEGDIDASITGHALLWEDTSDTLRAVSAAKPLPVVQTGTHNIGTVTTVTAVTAISNALPAGTNAIGKLAANSGVDIGDVDVASIIPGTGATNLGKAEDAGHTTGDVGVMALAVRKDTAAAIAGTDLDYTPLQVDALGYLRTSNISIVTDDAAFTPASGSGIPIMGFADETSPDGVDEGDAGVVRMTLQRGLHMNLRNSSGVELTPAASSQFHKAYNTTSTQTGTDVITPTSGKKLAITSVIVGTYGTTAARLILWFGDNADTTYTAGTDQVLLSASFAPSTTSKPGLVFTPAFPIFCNTADRELHITTDAALSVDITIEYFEIS